MEKTEAEDIGREFGRYEAEIAGLKDKLAATDNYKIDIQRLKDTIKKRNHMIADLQGKLKNTNQDLTYYKKIVDERLEADGVVDLN